MITVEDLPDQTLGQKRDLMLYCEECGRFTSANRGDYFFKQAKEAFVCRGTIDEPHDATYMVLAREIRRIEIAYR